MSAQLKWTAATRFALLLSTGWSCMVAAFARGEYHQGAEGYGVTTRAVVSERPVGFVASHPIFATTIHTNPTAILILLVFPISLIFAAKWALSALRRTSKG